MKAKFVVLFIMYLISFDLIGQVKKTLEPGYYILHKSYSVFSSTNISTSNISFTVPKGKVFRIDGAINGYYQVYYNGDSGFALMQSLKNCIPVQSTSTNITSSSFQYDFIKSDNRSVEDLVKENVTLEFKDWLTKGEFEKTQDYLNRTSSKNQEKKLAELTNKHLAVFEESHIVNLLNQAPKLSLYDADNEVFKISFTENDILLRVPIEKAPSFKNNFNKYSFRDFDLILNQSEWIISNVNVYSPEGKIIYSYSITDQPEYLQVNQFDIKITDLDINMPQEEVPNNYKEITNKNIILAGKPEVDLIIPKSNLVNRNTYCLVIGNEDYSSYQNELESESNVRFAINDARVFTKYLINTLGIPERNISLITNGTNSSIRQEIDRLGLILKNTGGTAEVIIYYAGHGLPDPKTKEPVIIPVDVSSANINYGIKLSFIIDELNQYPSKRTTFFIDACFSGGARYGQLANNRDVRISPKIGYIEGNTVIFSSSSGNQVSGPYDQMQHGIFTYFLLKKLQESSGNITYGELADYLIKQVPIESLLINNIEQTPKIQVGQKANNYWESWTFK